MYRAITTLLVVLTTQAVAHDMTPTYPEWYVSHIQGVVKTPMTILNKRQDVEYYEISVTDKDGKPVPFVSLYKIAHVKYLQRLKFDIYINSDDVPRAQYICSRSKLRGEGTVTVLSSKICSKIR
jgi:hypothetical protein